jgi:ribosomal protein S18 acetylase RimI-like enzyme
MPTPERDNVRIRTARLEDVPAVKALLAATWHDTYDSILGPERVREITQEWHAPERLASQVDQAATAFLLAEIGDTVVGTGFAHMIGPGEAEIGRLYVLPAHQCHGIGARLLAALVASLGDARRFELEVEPRNTRAIRFYERAGFLAAGSTSDCGRQGRTYEAIVMRLVLPGR